MTEALTPSQWLTLAADDLAAARVLHAQPARFSSQACFLAQQCAERSVKAVIMHLHADVPRTHALTDLWAVARAAGAPASLEVEAASVLSPYAVEVRYAGLDRITEAEATEALRLARGVLAWASRFIAE